MSPLITKHRALRSCDILRAPIVRKQKQKKKKIHTKLRYSLIYRIRICLFPFEAQIKIQMSKRHINANHNDKWHTQMGRKSWKRYTHIQRLHC